MVSATRSVAFATYLLVNVIQISGASNDMEGFSCVEAEPEACAYKASGNCGSFALNNGADVDAWLAADNGQPCSVIGGSLTIQQWNIKAADLQKMLPLVAVCGSVTIQQLATGTLAGLDNLTYIGGSFFLAQNARPWASVGDVDDISALSSLRYVGGAMNVVENYHLTKSDVEAGFRNLSVAGAVNVEFYDNPPTAGGAATISGSVKRCSSSFSEKACPPACMTCQEGGAADGGVALDSNGKCTEYCSIHGYCGTTEIYRSGGTNCSTCVTFTAIETSSKTVTSSQTSDRAGFSCSVAKPEACAYKANSTCGAFVLNNGADIDAWLEADNGQPCRVIGGSLTIQQWNIKAEDLQKMLPLVAVCGSVTIQQLATGTLAGLDNLTYIGGSFFLAQNARPWASVGDVDDISALSSLRYVGGAMNVVQNYHLSKRDLAASFRNLSVAGAVNIEFYDNAPTAGEAVARTGNVDRCKSSFSEAACPSMCLTCREGGAADGGVALDSNGMCTEHCSSYGYCGTTEIYRSSGTDCSRCKVLAPIQSESAAVIKGSFVVTLADSSSVLDDPVAKAALEKSIGKYLALSLDVDGVTASDVTVVLSAAEEGSGRRLRLLSGGLQARYTITVPASVADASNAAGTVVQKINSKTPGDMTVIVNDALLGASVEAPILAHVQATDVRITVPAALEMARDDEDSHRSSAADPRRLGCVSVVILAITSLSSTS